MKEISGIIEKLAALTVAITSIIGTAATMDIAAIVAI